MPERKPPCKRVGKTFLRAADAFEQGESGCEPARNGAGEQAPRAVVAAGGRDSGREPFARADNGLEIIVERTVSAVSALQQDCRTEFRDELAGGGCREMR